MSASSKRKSSHGTERHMRGAFYSPKVLVSDLVKDVSSADNVLDPSCGDGAFLVALAQRVKTELSEDAFVGYLNTKLFGVDVDPVAVAGATAALTSLAPDGAVLDGLRAHLKVGDALWTPRFVWDAEFPGVLFDVVLGNPPWAQVVSHKNYSEEHKQRIKDFLQFLNDENGKSNGEYKRSASCPKFNLFDLFLQRAMQLARSRILMIIPKTFMGNVQQTETRKMLFQNFPIHSIRVFGQRETSAAFPGVTGTASLVLNALRAQPPTTLALSTGCSLSNLSGSRRVDLPYTIFVPPYYSIPMVEDTDLDFLAAASQLPARIGNYVESHTGFKPSAAFLEGLVSKPTEGYLPLYKGCNITGPYALSNDVDRYYDPATVPAPVAALAGQRRIAMKHVCTFSEIDSIRTCAVVFEPGMMADDSVYFYVPNDPTHTEPLLEVLNSPASDRYLRFFTEKNLPQALVKSIPCNTL